MRPTLLLLPAALALAPGCKIDSNLNKADKDDEVFDTGDPNPFETAEETDSPPDTQETSPPPPECPDQYFPGANIPQASECMSAPSVGTWTPQTEWERMTFSDGSGSSSCMMQPIVCSLTDDNGDGRTDEHDDPDIVILTYSPGVLRAMSGIDGTEIWSAATSGLQITGGAACGDIDNDGWQDVLALTSSSVVAYEGADGTVKWTSRSISGSMDGTSDAPGIADMDGDGNPEIIAGKAILDNAGNVVGTGAYGWGSSSNVGSAGFAVDIDQDGDLEAIAGNAIYDIDGNALWRNSGSDGYPAVGNFDGDDYGEIVVTGDARMRIMDDDGTDICSAAIPMASGSYGGPPTVADFDGDGEAEVGVAANSTYTVYEADCSILWQYTGTTDPSSGNTGSSVFDFEGDGVADVVYADERWVWVFNGADGSVKMQDTNHTNNTWLEYPTIADVDGDGSAEIAVCNTPGSWGSKTGVTVFGDVDSSWRAGREIWNQHGYSITNINDDGSIPTEQETNWLSYNNFRSGDLTPGIGYSGPDLFAELKDVCNVECDRDSVTVWFQIANQGFNDITDPINVDLIAQTDSGAVILTSYVWSAGVPAGTETESVSLTATGVPHPIYDLTVAVDGGNSESLSEINECYEDNNEDTWGAVVCP